LFFVGLDSNQSLVLGIVQQLAEFLEAIAVPVEAGLVLMNPLGQFVRHGAVVDVQAVRFEDVAQQRDGLFGFGAGLFGGAAALQANHVAAFAAGDFHVVGLLQ